MTRLLPAFLLLMASLSTAHAQTLASLTGRSRVLLLFAPSDSDPRFQSQRKLLSRHFADMKERDLICIPILLQTGPPTGADTLRQLEPPPVSDSEQILIRRQFHIPQEDFVAILIGKDGGEKLRSSAPLTIERLNQVIDAMPMRQEERKRKPPR